MNNGLEQVEFKSTTVSDGFVGLRYKKDKIYYKHYICCNSY